MSRIADLGTNYVNLPVLLEEYDQAFANIERDLSLKGKTIEVALKEQGSMPYFYESRRVELRTVMKYLDLQVAKVRGKLVRRFKETYSRDLGERQLNSYVDQEEEYLKMHELYLECEELYEKYSAAVESFTKRGYALRDLTQARINSIQDTIL